MKSLSVVVASRNNAPWLRQCLDSLMEQTLRDFEVVVVDDASKDESGSILREYASRFPGKVRPVFLRQRVGVARARDEGIREAESEFLSTLDGDDYLLHPRKLEAELALVQQSARKGIEAAAFSDVQLVDEDCCPLKYQMEETPMIQGRITKALLGRACRIPRDFTFRRELYYKAGGYDSRFPIYEDWDFKLRLSSLVEFLHTGIKGIAYRCHDNGLSAAPLQIHLRWLRKGFQKNRGLVSSSHQADAADVLERKLNEIRDRYLREYVNGKGHTWTACRYLLHLGYRGEALPGWRSLIRRLVRIPGKTGRYR